MKIKINSKWIAKTSVVLTAVTAMIASVLPVQALDITTVAADGSYHLVDFASDTELSSYSTYKDAASAWSNSRDSYDNLGIILDNKVMLAEYGTAIIRSTDACDVNVTYTEAVDGEQGYTNGCYGVDAAYLATSADGTEAEFVLSGVTGWASLDDIKIVPTENITFRMTAYTVQSGRLYHEIKTEITDDYYASILDLGNAPSYLEDGNTYYSSDGHYFYRDDSYNAMIDDLRNGTHTSSMNPDDPWYDYYQFVSHRTLTNVTESQMESYLSDTMGIIGKPVSYQDDDKDSADDTRTRSQYYGELSEFWQYQYEYGSNALMMFALSLNESAGGTSALSYSRNNLFGHAAYDSDVEANASRYLTVANSVYSHAKYYISGSYASPLKSMFRGSFFGNKSSGMNVSYASDPYWGEKAAVYYRQLDEGFGSVDENQYTLGIKTSSDAVDVYQYPQADSDVLYTTRKNPDFSFVILSSFSNDDGDWYQVQSEATMDEDSKVALSYNYDYSNDLAYIRQSDVQVILTGKETEQQTYVHVTFDAAGGTFPGDEATVTYALPTGSAASAVTPTKDHALFSGWDQSTDSVSQDTTFTAQYQDVTEIELTSTPKQDYELNDKINLENGIITVHFTDGTSKEVSLDTTMVSGFNLASGGDQTVTVTYAGCTAEYTVNVNGDSDTIRSEIKQEIQVMIEQYADKDTLSDWDTNAIIALKQKIDENMQPYLTQAELRSFDKILRKAYGNRIRYVLEKNPYDLQVSGLSVSYPLDDSLDKFWLVEDTYRIRVSSNVSDEAITAMTRTANYLEDSINESFNVVIRKNYSEPDPEGPLLITISKPEGTSDSDVFTVLHYIKDTGDVVECYTRQTDGKITFMTRGEGSYMVLSRRTSNVYTGDDPVESLTSSSSSWDIEKIAAYASLVLGLFILMMILIYRHRKKTTTVKVKQERVVKNEQEAKKPAPPADMTQALQNLETTMIDLKADEIRKAADQENRKNGEKHQ